MHCQLRWTSRNGALRGERHIFDAYEDAMTEVASAVPRLDQGDVLELTSNGKVMLSLRCEKAPARTDA
ncbi:hypothetical protein IBL26_16355 [Roseomonas aerophila]|uniref:DUF306 domain-containing protein n=1 Tax=Teichococcus aerophilus TaxID=1224513 RepID=A0ABR7RQI7_9PROT|nr:hypothetical protein [Pseudoroseomonas aerophila]MBC9208420.1 hypothetical protein [Pseudoroseomonas aerophila]